MSPPRVGITGRPGVGKSTLFMEIVNYLAGKGLRVGGIIAPEVREGGVRIGFKLVDLLSKSETWLARKDVASRIRVGSYGVLESASSFVRESLSRALEVAEVIGIDEIGPMELKLAGFPQLVREVANSDKPFIFVVHYRLSEEGALDFLGDYEKIVVTPENRALLRRSLPPEIYKRVAAYLGK